MGPAELGGELLGGGGFSDLARAYEDLDQRRGLPATLGELVNHGAEKGHAMELIVVEALVNVAQWESKNTQ